MTFYPKTFLMNILVSVGLALMGLALVQQKIESEAPITVAMIAIPYLIIVMVFALTAYGLTYRAPAAIHIPLAWTNGVIAGLILLGSISAAFFGVPIFLALFGAFLYAIPQILNVLTLREFARNTRALAKPEVSPQSSIPTGVSRMKIRIVDKSTSKQVYLTEIHLNAQNYSPTAEEYFKLAWQAAVEDAAVKEAEKENYLFMVVAQP